MTQHILLYTDEPGVGGIAQYNHSVVLALAQRGDRVTVVQSYRDNPLLTEQREAGIQHHWLDFDTMADFQRTFAEPADAQAALQTYQPDLILFSDGCPLSNFAAKQVAIDQQMPFLIVVGFVAPNLSQHFPTGIDPAPVLHRLAIYFEQAKAVVAVSQNNLDLLRSLFHLPTHQGEVIHYGRPPQYFEPRRAAVRDRLRTELQLPEAAVLCLTPARLEPIKGYQYQLDAILRLRQEGCLGHLHFAWAGEGQLRAWLEQTIQREALGDRIHLLGQRWDIADWLDAADMFVLPSEVEGMPLAIMEAMAKGLPVIATAVSGIPEELGDTGVLLPDPTVDAEATGQTLAETLFLLEADSQGRTEMGQAGRQRAQQYFQAARMVQETLNVIDRSLLPAGDYVSPGLAIVRPDAAFPNKVIADPQTCPWPYLRHNIPHNWYVDQRQPLVGFLSRDEAQILYNTARQFQGKRALEIGCWVGWSACHLALAGVRLDVIDPLLERPEFFETVDVSLTTAGVRDRVNLQPGYSPAAVHELARLETRRWSLIFIDGNHEAPGPLEDAIVCAQYAEADALVIFHDLASPAVSAGLDYFKQQGWQTRVYQTMQIMGVAWRGQVQPIAHQPDPRVTWTLPAHLQGYEVSGVAGESLSLPVATPLDAWLQQIDHLQLEPLPAIAPTLPERQQYIEMRHRAKAAYIQGEWDEAIANFQAMLNVNPASAIAHAHLSTLWRSRDLAKRLHHHALAQSAHTLTPPDDAEFLTLRDIVRPYTLLSPERLFSLYSLTKQICLDDIPGDVVECGTYRGGAAALMAAVIQRYSLRPRQLYACDTFTGMPDPTAADRHAGVPANLTGFGAGTLSAPVAQYLDQICQLLGVSEIVVPVPGLFAKTLPALQAEVDSIALLHADGDWYESTMDIFKSLYQKVVPEGFIQIDDYGHWSGCRQAVHEFERSQNAAFPLRAIDYTGVWFRKTDPADPAGNWWRSLWLTAQTAQLQQQFDLAERLLRGLLKLLPGLVQAEHGLIELGLDPAEFTRTMTNGAAALAAPPMPELNLRSLTWVAFPDWQQPEDGLLTDLMAVLRFGITHPDRERLSLLLVADADPDLVELALAAASLQLVETESLELEDDRPAIGLIPPLSSQQWQSLLPHLNGYLQLSAEERNALTNLQTAIALHPSSHLLTHPLNPPCCLPTQPNN
jgi:glycosyltransferase involved in cell wall biosynthesis/predicted O-methyltransferase YrrM